MGRMVIADLSQADIAQCAWRNPWCLYLSAKVDAADDLCNRSVKYSAGSEAIHRERNSDSNARILRSIADQD